MGGEEFAVLFSCENAEQSLIFAEKLRRAVEALGIEHSHNPASDFVTASFGLVTTKRGDLTEDLLYKSADDALYKAKDGGRNSIVQVVL